MASLVWILSLLSIVLSTTVLAEDMTIFSMSHVPDWQQKFNMVLSITAPDGDAVPLQFELFPLTRSMGLNESDRTRMAVQIRGPLVSLDSDDFDIKMIDSNAVVSLNCDPAAATAEIRALTRAQERFPRAILLYSLDGDCCGIQGSNLSYQSIFTMANPSEAQEMLNYTQTGTGQATISGNTNTTTPDGQNGQSGSNSAVAMSILYSITGLITLLFLVIIATGAIRAHRYPERYGPRSGHGGRPRQSRAKGIARAVLETIPIVKFGESNPPKPDPALELEHQPSRSSHDPATGTRLSAIPEEVQTPRVRLTEGVPPTIAETPSEHAATDAARNTSTTDVNAVTHGPNDEHLGCSICTEDFTVGEDVRVLPCDHKFHPHCIDPWLINISGTCPLCRLDLRPPCKEGAPPSSGSSSSDDQHLPPPLAGDVDGNHQQSATTSSNNQRRRSSRLLDLHRLRHASVEERIEILRLHRTHSRQQLQQQAQQQAQAQAQTGGEDAEGRGTKLADRLRDKFRIRTTRRGESPGRGGTDREAAGSDSTA